MFLSFFTRMHCSTSLQLVYQ